MAKAKDGRLGGFMGVSDAAFAGYLHAPAEAISDAAVRFLLCTALKTHILHESVVEPV